jgi:predicted CXXCH cytochrome family protein
MTVRILRTIALPAAAVLALVATACTDDESPAVTTPELDAAFLGYSNPETRQTVCGNCHVSQQRTWRNTGHAGAWADLQASGHAASYCNACHTVNGTSNLAPDTAGFFSVAAEAQKFYYDVQCESCHGPGAAHVQAPDASQPLVSIRADTALGYGCATCHKGTHTPFVEEWRSSLHNHVQSAVFTNGAPRADCIGCHTAQGALAAWDPNSRYVESSPTAQAQYQPLTCAVCHDPHGTENSGELRWSIETPDADLNLCMKCHQRRSVPDVTSSRGPHAPQGPTLLGESGWLPPNFTYDPNAGASTHGTQANPRLCAGCHMEAFSAQDAQGQSFYVVGHRFEAIPCVDANGRPTGATDCAYNAAARRWTACAGSGCHTSEAQAINFFNLVKGRLEGYRNTLWKDGDGDGTLDAFPTDSGLVPIVRANYPSDFSTTDNRTSVGEGAFFNASLLGVDGSSGVHNPFYIEALLQQSITALRNQYPGLPAPPPEIQALISRGVRR